MLQIAVIIEGPIQVGPGEQMLVRVLVPDQVMAGTIPIATQVDHRPDSTAVWQPQRNHAVTRIELLATAPPPSSPSAGEQS